MHAWNGKGNALVGLGKYDEALICFEKALELDPDFVHAWNGKGTALYRLVNYNEALICFEKALELDPKYVHAWNGKGAAFYALGKYDDALTCFDRALKLDPEYSYSWNHKGATLESLNRSSEAAMAYSLGRERELNSATKLGIFAVFLVVYSALAMKGYVLSRRLRKYTTSIVILLINSLGFLTIMWVLSGFFDPLLVGQFLVGGVLIILVSVLLWCLSGFPANPWMAQLILWIEDFARCRSLLSRMKLALGSLSIEDFEKSQSLLPRMIQAISLLAVIAYATIAAIFYFRLHLGTEISMVHFLKFAFFSIPFVGLVVTILPILAAMLSKNLDRGTRNILLIIQFGHLGISGLYLGLILWIFEIESFDHPFQLGTSRHFLGFMMSLFLLAILIPYISGSKRSSRWNVVLLEKERSWLDELLNVLDIPTPTLYVSKLQKILDEIKDDDMISVQGGDLDRIKSLYGAGVLRLDPRFRYVDFLMRLQGRIDEKIDQFEELKGDKEVIKETARIYADAYRLRRDELVGMIEKEGQFKPRLWVALAIILTPVLGQILASLINWILKAMIETNLGGIITSTPALPFP